MVGEVPVKRMQATPDPPQKQAADLAASNSDDLVDSDVIACSIHIDYEEKWWQHAPLSVSNTQGKWWWFNSVDTDPNG